MRTKIAAFIAIAALGSTARAEAQNYQPVRVDLTLVVAYGGSGDISAWGGGIAVEPKYNLTDQLSLGLRLEYSGLVSQSYTLAGLDLSVSARGVLAILAKADYYFTTSSSRPFLGLGAGYYSIGSSDVGSTGMSAEAFSGFGVFPQFGVNFGHFRLAVGYHAIFGEAQTVVVAGIAPPTLSKNYVAFEIGGTFGGARTTPEAQ
jgi:outer membrane protein W